MPDIFDQIAPEAPASSSDAQGDIFDQVAPDAKPNAFQVARASRSHGIDYLKNAQDEQSNLESYTQAHPILGNIFSAANAAKRGMAGAAAGQVGLFNPKYAHAAEQGLQAELPAIPGMTTTVAETAGNVLENLPSMVLPGGQAAVMAVQGAGQTRADIAGLREEGQDISGMKEALAATGMGVLQGGAGLLLGKAGGAVERSISGLAGKVLSGALLNTGVQAGSNLIRKTYDPNATVGQGLGQAALTGGILSPLLHAIRPGTAPAAEEAPIQAPDGYDFAALDQRLAGADREASVEGGAEVATPPPELTQAFSDPRMQAPEEVGPASVEGEQQAREAADRMAAVDRSDERTTSATDETNEGRRFEDIATPDQVSFQTPEEVNPLLKNIREAQSGMPLRRRAGAVSIPGYDTLSTMAESVKGKIADIDKEFHGGFTETAGAKKTALDIRNSAGTAELAGHNFESQITPYREHLNGLSDAAKAQWMDTVEAGGNSPVPEAQPAVDAIRTMRQQNAARATKLGINNLDDTGGGLSRMFEFPESGGKAGSGSVAGTNSPFFRQQYDTYSEALKAATAAGGKPRFENPLDAQIARQYEVEKNLSARENLRKAEDAGTAEWVENGKQPVAADKDTKLNDPILGHEERRMALPSWMVGKYSQMEGFESHKYLEDNANKMVAVRPGEQPPQGYSFTPIKKSGSFQMGSDSAAKYNNLISSGKYDSVATLGQTVGRSLVKFRYDMNLAHAANAMITGGFRQVANVMQRAGGLEFGEAGKSLMDAMTGGYLKGRGLRRALESGTAGEVGDRVMGVNPKLNLRSVTDSSAFSEAGKAFKDGDIVGGVTKAVAGTLRLTHDLTFKELLPNILAGHLATVAEGDIRNGISEAAGRTKMAAEADTLSKAIGHHMQTPDFQKNLTRDVANFVMPASQFLEGQLRVAGGALRGNPQALALLTSGTVLTAAIGTAVQMASTYATTGKAIAPTSLQDMISPKTGRKDESGHDERITLPGPISRAYRTITSPTNELSASIHPAITGTLETVRNKDFQGNQVRPDDASPTENFARGAWHIGKGMLPMNTPDIAAAADAKQTSLGEKAMSAVGLRFSHPVTSAAEQTAYDLLNQRQGSGGRNLAAQQQHANDKQWVQSIRGGSEDTALADMEKDPQMTIGRAESIYRRGHEPAGLAGLVTDTQFTPHDLLSIWNKATDDEKPTIKDGILQRLAGAKPASEADLIQWQALMKAVGE